MSIAAVIVEILVIGVQTWVALMLWALGYLGHGVVLKPLSLLAAYGGAWKWSPLFLVILLAVWYTLGIVMDRVARVLFDRLIRPLLRGLCPAGIRRLFADKTRPIIEEDEVFVRVLYQEKGLSAFLQDSRSRMRIARATLINSVLIWAAFWISPQLRHLLPMSMPTFAFVTTLGGIFLILWVGFWALQHITYRERLEQARRVMNERAR